jgi:hypothetical protein
VSASNVTSRSRAGQHLALLRLRDLAVRATIWLSALHLVKAPSMKPALCIAVLFFATSVADGQCGLQSIVGSDTLPDDLFGISVAMSRDTLVVGSSLASSEGGVYIFERGPTGFQEVAILFPTTPSPGQRFGISVAIDGDLIAVGAAHFDSGLGIVYVYERSDTGWDEVYVIPNPLTAYNDAFGKAVAVQGEFIFVGRPFPTPFGPAGAPEVQVYERNVMVWDQVQIIEPSVYSFMFGYTMAVDGDRLLVGAQAPASDDPGSAYIFVRTVNGWVEEQRLTASDGESDDRFGYSVALDGDRALVGAVADDVFSGSVYVFERDTQSGAWAEVAKLTAPSHEEYDSFGSAVALGEGSAVVGSSSDDVFGVSSGSIYEFAGSGANWSLVEQRFSPSPAAGDVFGYSLALANGTLAIGAVGADYVVIESDEFGIDYCAANQNSTGSVAQIIAQGDCDVAANDIMLSATQLPPNKFGYFLLSQTQAFFPNAGGSQGNLCIGGPIGRFQALVQNSGPAGAIAITVDLTNVPLFGAILAGETWNFTCWYRDVGGNSNFTGGIEIPFS